MSLLDLPRSVVGGALRLARLPFDLVLGRGAERPEAPERAPRPSADEVEEREARARQADELRRAVKPEGTELKEATERAKEERRRTDAG